MYKKLMILSLAVVMAACQSSTKSTSSDQDEAIAIFNGKNLEGWRGDSRIWSVKDGAIVGQTTDENQIDHNTFLIYEKPFSDFELSFQYKIIGGNSGVQYRAKVLDESEFIVGGYQGDMEAGTNYSGILYEEKGRGILALRGEKVMIGEDGEKTVEQFSTGEAIQAKINMEQWNSYRIVANGERLQHFINDTNSIDVTDKEVGKRASSGIFALQVHKGPNMKVFYKDIVVKPIVK